MIPYKIHYIWLGKGQKPKSFKLALGSWNKYAASYEIIEWNEDNIAEFDLPIRFQDLMSKRKWAFASDILRFHILEKYGGIYFDVDQVLIKNIPDSFLTHDFFIATYHEVNDYYGFGLIGTIAKGKVIIAIRSEMDAYEGEDIIVNKVGGHIINSLRDAKCEELTIFPQDYFYPLTVQDHTGNTFSYHMSNTSWIPWWKKAIYLFPGYIHIQRMVKKLLPRSIQKKLFKIDYL